MILKNRLRPIAVVLATVFILSGQAYGAEKTQIAVVIHVGNPIHDVNAVFVRDVFMKRRTSWSDGKPIIVLNQKAKGKTRKVFDQAVFSKSATEMATYWITRQIRGHGAPPPAIDTDSIVLAIVSKQRNAIGYVRATPQIMKELSADSRIATKTGAEVRVLKIDGVLPGDPKYPITSH